MEASEYPVIFLICLRSKYDKLFEVGVDDLYLKRQTKSIKFLRSIDSLGGNFIKFEIFAQFISQSTAKTVTKGAGNEAVLFH